jgi:uncharacterized protein (TIGR03086 family)
MEAVELYRGTAAHWQALVGAVRPDQWSAPTPCPKWDVRALVNHVVGEQLWLPPLMAGQTIAEVGDRFDGDLLGEDPVAVAAAANTGAVAAVPPAVAEARTVHLSYGESSAEEYARGVAADQLVHGWDLAAAIGADRALDASLVAAVTEWYTPKEPFYREAGEVAARPDVPADDPATRLLVAFGRDPHWAPAA